MSMIDPYAPVYTFSYKKIEEPVYKYIKDRNKRIHKIKLTEYVTRHTASSDQNPQIYVRYQIQVTRYMQNKMQRIMNIVLNKEDEIKKEWVDIKSEFYSRDFYSEFSPSGLVTEDRLYGTEEEAQKGEPSYLFREYNYKD